MAKKFFSFFLFFFITSNLFSQDVVKKYKILINLCKQIADVNCELKYYSYLYDLVNENEKEKIKKKVTSILKNLPKRRLKKLKTDKFKKNDIYFLVLSFKERGNQVNNKSLSNITIGLLIPLSEEFKDVGLNILKGVMAGINFFGNSQIKFRIKIYDTSNFDNSTFINFCKNNLNIIIGPVINQNALKILPFLDKFQIPAILLTPNLNFAKYGKYIFTHNNNPEDEIKYLCKTILNDNVKNLAIMYPENQFGVEFKNLALKYCPSSIIKSIASYSPDAYDFKAPLFQIGDIYKKDEKFIHSRKIDGIFIADDVKKAIFIIPEIFFYDFKNVKIYGTDLWNSKILFKLDKKFLKNITFFDCVDYNEHEEFNFYIKNYLNSKPNFLIYLGYDTMQIIKNIDFTDKITIYNSLIGKKFFLLTGLTYFDKNGISHKSMKIFRINFKEN